MPITSQEATNVFTDALVARWNDNTAPTNFLQGFFESSFKPSKYAKIAVRRGKRFVSVDVQRYSDGKLNVISFSDEKKFLPPMFNDYIVMNDHELYDNIVGMIASMANGAAPEGQSQLLQMQLQSVLSEMNDEMMLIKDNQLRAVELMCAQVLRSGILQLNATDNIDFKRKATSIVDLGAGNYWANGVDPFKTLENGCRWMRKNGYSSSTTIDALFGVDALNDLETNSIFVARIDLRNFNAGQITEPQRPKAGAEFHGVLYCGPFTVNVWTYDQYYTHPTTGIETSYLDEKEVVLIPSDAKLTLTWHLVPQNIREGATIPQTGEFLIQRFLDDKKGSDELYVKCAPIVIPVSIDLLYTVKVKA